MNELVENLKKAFASYSKDELKAIIQSGAHLSTVGMRVTDYLEQKGYHVKILDGKINFEKANFSDKLGPNTYSDFFYIKNQNLFYGARGFQIN